MKTHLIKTLYLSLFLCSFFICNCSSAFENTFYVLHEKPEQKKALARTLTTIKKHHRSISMLISQAYQINEEGLVSGYVNEELVALAKLHSIKLMAMVTNISFDKSKVHTFLASQPAQQKAIQSILDACNKYHFYGIQFDLEHVSLEDKARLTQFYNDAAKALHQAHYKVSVAIIPAFEKNLDESIFLRRMYQNWAGVYDLKALGKSADFVTIMAYNQHNNSTLPGPNASIQFARAAIKNALKEIPASKLSLGIPTYSIHWYSGHETVAPHESEMNYQDASTLIKKYHAQIFWNKKEKVHQAIFMQNWLNEYVYLEDAASFKAKMVLSKQFKLRGMSVFRIGDEDYRIWNKLSSRKLSS